jgi:O-antigen ligase
MRLVKRDFFKKNLIPFLYSFGIFGFPFMSFFPVFLGVESRPISMSMRAVVVLVSLYTIFPIKKKVIVNKYFVSFLVFWLFYSLRIGYTYMTENEIVFFMSNFMFISFAYGACFLPSLALFSSLHKLQWEAENIFNATFVVIFIATVSSIYLSFKTGLEQSESVGRMSTSVLNPITLGHTGISLLLLSLYHLISKREVKKSNNLLYILGALVGILAALSAASKGPIVSFVAVLLLYVIFTLNPKKIITFTYFGLIAGLFIWQSLDFLEEKFGLQAFKRFEGLLGVAEGSSKDMSTDSRVHHIHDAWEQFLSSPLFGSGIVEQNSGYYPHNIYLESLISTGLIGGMLFIFLSLSMVQKSILLLKNNRALGWGGLLAIQYSTGAMFSGSLSASNPVWLSMAFVYSASIYYSKQENNK